MAEIAKIRYTHDAVIDEILINPSVSQGELAKMFGFSQAWMSICINSDAFQERLKERKAEMVDPHIVASITERLDAVARRALDKILDRLDSPTANLKTMELVNIAKLGVGDKNMKQQAPLNQNNLYVVQLPAPAQNSQSWLNNVGNTSRVELPIAQEVVNGN